MRPTGYAGAPLTNTEGITANDTKSIAKLCPRQIVPS
jgi:hypothetical protein